MQASINKEQGTRAGAAAERDKTDVTEKDENSEGHRLPSSAADCNWGHSRTREHRTPEDETVSTPLFNACSGYRRLDAYAMASIVQLATLRFCRRFLNRTNDPCGRQRGFGILDLGLEVRGNG